QKPHERVQMLPRIMNVAVPRVQHSPRFGQAADSQTVCSFSSVTSVSSSAIRPEVGVRTFSQGGRGPRSVLPRLSLGCADAMPEVNHSDGPRTRGLPPLVVLALARVLAAHGGFQSFDQDLFF